MEAPSEQEDRYGPNCIKSADIPLLSEQWRLDCVLREVGELHTLRIGRSGLSAGSPVPRPMHMCGLSRFRVRLNGIRYNTARSSASDGVRTGSLLVDHVQLCRTEQRRPQCCSQHGHNIRQGLLGQFVLLEKRMPQGLPSRVPGKLIGQTGW